MRVVLLGKGGSGKSTLAGLLCAELSDRGERVLAMDGDTVPGVTQALGMAPTDDWLLAGMASMNNGGWQLDTTPAEAVRRCSREGPGGVRFLQLGNADGSLRDFELRRWEFPERWSATVAFNTLVRTFDDDGWVIVDLQGGTLQVAGGMIGTTGTAIVVVEPFAKSVLTARRFLEMGEWPDALRLVGVANKVTSVEDEAFVQAELERLGIPLWASVPDDDRIRRAERESQPVAFLDDDSPARRAVAELARQLEAAGGRSHAARVR